MKTLILTNVKFKKYQEKIDNLLSIYAFKNINNTTYIGKIEKEELETVTNSISDIINEDSTILIIQLTPKSAENIITIGKPITLEEEKYKFL